MPVKFALTCAQCDAPLPTPTRATGSFRCGHCGATTAFALSADEVALFTGGLRAEEGRDGDFTLSGLGHSLSAQLESLSAKVDESVRLTGRLQLPHLRETLGEQRAALQSREREIAQLLAQIERRRSHLSPARWILWIVVGLIIFRGVVSAEPVALVIGLVGAALLWWRGSRQRAKWDRVAAELRSETQPEIDELERVIAETEQLIDDLERPPSRVDNRA
jgi:hypothetical protein